MKKLLCIITLVICLMFTACGGSAKADALMTGFMNGALEGVQFGDGSEAARDYEVWYDMLGGECISAVAGSPQEYWEIWCENVEDLYAANGYEFFVEQDCPISAKYIALKYGLDG